MCKKCKEVLTKRFKDPNCYLAFDTKEELIQICGILDYLEFKPAENENFSDILKTNSESNLFKVPINYLIKTSNGKFVFKSSSNKFNKFDKLTNIIKNVHGT